jgi:glycosyltransferase involved in cell wall biosynthesis
VRVTYVLPQPELGGGNKVAAQHASLLRASGVDVTMIADGPRPRWLPYEGRYIDRDAGPVRLPTQDVMIATFWTTVAVAESLQCGPVAHFCQGYEGFHEHLRPQWPDIEATYRSPRPMLTVTPHLGRLLAERFSQPFRVTPPVVDPRFRPRRRHRSRRVPWIAIGGVFEAPVKDVPTALDAVQQLRAAGRRSRVLRISALPQSPDERAILVADRYLHHVAPGEVAAALGGCDLLLFTSRAAEGFGLPLLEAMAAGVPAVSSRVPSTEFMTEGAVPLVEAGDAAALAAAAAALLDDDRRWRAVRRRGIEAAARFSSRRIAPQLIEAVQWAAGSGSRIT